MNWYKKAKTVNDLETILDEKSGLQEIVQTLTENDYPHKVVTLPEDTIVTINTDEGIFLIQDLEYPEDIENAVDWIWKLSDMDLYSYTQLPEFETDFWKNLPFTTVYHATTEENLPNIQQNGLETRGETRGISNRSTPAAVFTSDNPDDTGSYGNIVLEINLHAMKQDNYTPIVSNEEPVDEERQQQYLAQKLGLNPDLYQMDSSDGIRHSTLIIYDNIPIKYISIYGN